MNTPAVSIKLVLFTTWNDALKIFLKDHFLPSQTIEQGMSLDEQVKKLFQEHTNSILHEQYVEQLYTVSSHNAISIVYFILVPSTMSTKHQEKWVTKETLPPTTADLPIITYAIQRLQWKIEYTNVVYSLLPREFTLSELQRTYEAILQKPLDKRNFRKKILSLHFLSPTEKKHIGNARPAQLYTFIERKPVYVNVF